MEYCRHKYNSTINDVLASSCQLCRVLAFEPALSIILINVLTIATPCDAPLTEKHILLDYPDLQDIRQKYFTASSLKDISETVDNQNSISFY